MVGERNATVNSELGAVPPVSPESREVEAFTIGIKYKFPFCQEDFKL